MPRPTPSDVHVDSILTRISIAYESNDFIATQIFPIVPVEKQSDYYFIYPKGPWFRLANLRRGPGAEAVRLDYTVSTGTYFCEVYSAAKGIPDEVRANADAPLRPDVDVTRFLTNQLMRGLEKRVADLVTNPGHWAYSASPAVPWSASNSDPIADVEAARERVVQETGRLPNVMVISYAVWRHLKNHPDLLDRLKYTNPTGVITAEQARSLFGVDKLLIGTASLDLSREGEPPSQQFIWGDDAWLGYVPDTPSLLEPAAGYIFEWREMGMARRVFRYREEARHQDVIEVQHATDEVITASDSGALIYHVI